MNSEKLSELLAHLTQNSSENEWVEFKLNFHSNEEIGKSISALANGACLVNQPNGYFLVLRIKINQPREPAFIQKNIKLEMKNLNIG